jgi:hypothetical protein
LVALPFLAVALGASIGLFVFSDPRHSAEDQI